MVGASKDGEGKAGRRSADPSVRVLRRFRTVFNAVRSHFRSAENSAGLSGAQVWAVAEIARTPGIGMGQLAAAMDVHQSTASNLVRTLLDAGYVASERGDEDRRAVHLKATARGMKALGKAPTPFTGVLPDALKKLDPKTLHRLEEDLDRLIVELAADPELSRVPLGSAYRARRGEPPAEEAPSRRARARTPAPASRSRAAKP